MGSHDDAESVELQVLIFIQVQFSDGSWVQAVKITVTLVNACPMRLSSDSFRESPCPTRHEGNDLFKVIGLIPRSQ